MHAGWRRRRAPGAAATDAAEPASDESERAGQLGAGAPCGRGSAAAASASAARARALPAEH